MENDSLIGQESQIYPFKFLNITHPLTAINTDTIISTWVAMALIFLVVIVCRYFLFKKNSLSQFIIVGVIKNFTDLVEQSIGKFIDRYYLFITSLFIFIISCNWIGIIPFAEEPTKDLNTTLALGIISFIYVHKEMIKTHGLKDYLKDFFMPINIMFPFNLIAGLIMLPLKILGELATVISISFRLFGNIFGGFVISSIYYNAISGSIILQLIGVGMGLIITSFFIVFEGFLQAFVFAILALTNIAMAIKMESESPESKNNNNNLKSDIA